MVPLSFEHQRDIDAFLSMVSERLIACIQSLVEDPPALSFTVTELRRGSLSHDLTLLAMIVEGKLYLLKETHQTIVKRVFLHIDSCASCSPDEQRDVQVISRIQRLVNQARLCVTDIDDLLTDKQAAELIDISVPTLSAHVEQHDLHPITWHWLELFDRGEVLALQHHRMTASSPQGTGGDAA
jgi:hypothetical protein